MGRYVVIGYGVTGAAAAHELAGAGHEVVVVDAAPQVGGRLQASTFAGVDGVDQGADSFLVRVPDATALCAELGLDDLVNPEPVSAAVWHDGRLHDIPPGLMLGVPGRLLPLARSGLLSWRGKLRAAAEPVLPRTPAEHDSIGRLVRARFGDEVHDRLIDALVGSIYAADTDRFSLAEVPQLAALADQRSLLVAARRAAARMPQPPGAAPSPIFATPRTGMASIVSRAHERATAVGTRFVLGHVPTVEVHDDGVHVAAGDLDDRFDGVVVAVPARAAATLLAECAQRAARLLGEAETADVAMVTLHVAADEWPERLSGRSGYLVPKSVQRSVTAVSFGSQKWAHWQPPAGGEIVRVSLGRDGAPVLHAGDDELVERTLADLHLQLGVDWTPHEVRVSRWPGAFAQYRPHHRAWVDSVRAVLPPSVRLAGASYDGIGVPACVRSGRAEARAVTGTRSLAD